MQEEKEKIQFDEFLEIEKKLEIKYGTIKFVERINKKMLKLTVDLNEEYLRTVVTNIGAKVDRDDYLVGCQFPFITNLAPAVISGFESTAMIMIVEDENGKIQWPTRNFEDGSKLF
jgi:tRNA-binding EMAP/Myf-like protein